MAQAPAIELTRVVKRYGTTTALSELSLRVERGQMFGLIGPDGAGKTTAIRLMCGLIHPDGGSLRVLGRDPVQAHREVTERVGYLSQRLASTVISASTRTSPSSRRSTAYRRIGHVANSCSR
jgi:ABC-2 type transport system ATP-binding protein